MEITQLPEECISHIISFTSPKDACRSSLVCPLFRSAMDSDVVWSKFLPHDYHQILSNSASASSMDSLSKKQLFFHLSDNHIIIDSDKNMSFKIDKESGKKCYMLGARRLSIIWGDTPMKWGWTLPKMSRFSEVAELWIGCSLDIKARIETNILSPKTTYGAYFVHKFRKHNRGFKEKPVEFQVYFEGEEEVHGHGSRRSVFLDPSKDEQQLCRDRGDGWMEVEMGEFFNDGGEDYRVVVCSLMETDDYTGNGKSGLVVEGIEFRPKSGI